MRVELAALTGDVVLDRAVFAAPVNLEDDKKRSLAKLANARTICCRGRYA